jgi:hypothetical protein
MVNKYHHKAGSPTGPYAKGGGKLKASVVKGSPVKSFDGTSQNRTKVTLNASKMSGGGVKKIKARTS